MARSVGVIGAGIGGLAIACRLAADGYEVSVYERNSQPGGKMNEIRSDGFRFDTGPSLLTMPEVVDELFRYCGYRRDRFLTYRPLEPGTRYYFKDGTEFNVYDSLSKTVEEIRRIAPEDEANWLDFLGYAAGLYQKTAGAFLFNPLQGLKDFPTDSLTDLMRIDALTTVSKRVNSYFESPYLRQFFKRFTTYNGSSPYKAPATLNVIPYVELCLGGYYIDGGMYRLIQALEQMAKDLGVQFHYNESVHSIEAAGGEIKGLRLQSDPEQLLPFGLVVSNADATETYLKLVDQAELPRRTIKKTRNIEPSCSGFVMLLGLDTRYEMLAHHTIFFSENYEKEFNDIFSERRLPDDPTIYVADTSQTNPDHAPAEGYSNLFVLINAPYTDGSEDWEQISKSYRDQVVRELENRGLDNLSGHIVYEKHITPLDFLKSYRSNCGSIYGTSSNSRLAAYNRPRTKSPYFSNLYLAGGSCHPGGGIPLVMLSSRHAHTNIRRDRD